MTEQIKLTPARLRVLCSARDGKVYQSGRAFDLYAVYERTDNGLRNVKRIADDLRAAGLLHTSDRGTGPTSLDAALTLTDAGAARLIELGLTAPARELNES